MADIIPRDSRYIPLTQQPYCCVPTCIQMIMLRRGMRLVPQELMGYYLGIVVPKRYLKYFWHGRTGKRPISGYGTQIFNKRYELNRAFSKLRIPLKAKLRLIDSFKDSESVKRYLAEAEKKDKDVLVCFDYGALYGTSYHYGHVCVLDRVYATKGEVRLVDPSRIASKWRYVKMDRLYRAMKVHGNARAGGLWELSEK